MHVDGIPEEGDHPPESAGELISQTPKKKKPRPKGEPGRSGECGFNIKASLELPEGMYEKLQVRIYVTQC
jgi:hypothetical protein